MEAITRCSGAAANRLSGATRLLHSFALLSQPDNWFLQKPAKETKVVFSRKGPLCYLRFLLLNIKFTIQQPRSILRANRGENVRFHRPIAIFAVLTAPAPGANLRPQL